MSHFLYTRALTAGRGVNDGGNRNIQIFLGNSIKEMSFGPQKKKDMCLTICLI